MNAWMDEWLIPIAIGIFNDFHAIIQPFNHAMVLINILLAI
ncbi:MAG: hypothetical protein WC557_11625 [Ignavibacteriaceae bacterium]